MKLTYTLNELDAVAKKIIEHTTTKTLLFYGKMGAGKTTLIKAIAKQLGIKDTARSPTFSLVNEYGEENKVYHFDFYRIEDETEAYDIGFEDYLASGAWICIEWPGKVENLLPDAYTAIYLSEENNNNREFVLKNIH